MSTIRSEPRHGLLALVVAGALALGGCGNDPERVPGAVAPTPAPTTAPAPPATDPVPAADQGLSAGLGEIAVAPDIVAGLAQALAERAEALLAGDLPVVRRGVAGGDPVFAAQQEQYAANLAQLPLQTLTLVPDPATLVRDGTAYWVNVAVTLELEGYDAVPVTTVDRYRFRPAAGGGFRLTSVTDPAWEQRNGVRSEPWDTGPIVVRSGAGVLGVFDPLSVSAAEPLLRSVEAGIDDVAAQVPYPWSRTVVVYALSDDAFLSSIPALPGEDPDALDAAAVPFRAAPTTTQVASVRLVLHRRMLERQGPGRDRLLRHELTHAAIGGADDQAPVWLGEGLAEWVSVQAQTPADRVVPRPAIRAARAGFTDVPPDDGFNDEESAAHYALSWWTVEYVASVAGPSGPWVLLDQLEAAAVAGGLDRTAEDAIVLGVAGVNLRTLARKAGKLMLASLAPPPITTPTTPVLPAPSGPAIPIPTDPVVPPPA